MHQVASETELDVREAPLHHMVARHLASRPGGSANPCYMFFTAGYLHFARHALSFMPAGLDVILLTGDLTPEEKGYIERKGWEAVHLPHHIDHNTALELIVQNTPGDFTWADADCFVNDPAVWEILADPGSPGDSNTAPFVYRPLGLAKTPLVHWHSPALNILREAGTSLCTYTPEETAYGRESAYAVPRRLRTDHQVRLQQVLRTSPDYPCGVHEGILDVYANGLTLHTTEREQANVIFGSATERRGLFFESTVLAQLVLRSYGLSTRLVLDLAHQVSDQIIHPGGISYRDKLPSSLGNRFTSRWRLTDLIEPPLLRAFLDDGAPPSYQLLLEHQLERLARGGIQERKIVPLLLDELTERGVEVPALRRDNRWAALFEGGTP